MKLKVSQIITQAVLEGVASGFINLVELKRENKTEDPSQQEVISFITYHVLESLAEVVDFQDEPVKIKEDHGEEPKPVIESRSDQSGATE